MNPILTKAINKAAIAIQKFTAKYPNDDVLHRYFFDKATHDIFIELMAVKNEEVSHTAAILLALNVTEEVDEAREFVENLNLIS